MHPYKTIGKVLTQVKVLWVVTLWIVVVWCQHFGWLCCFHIFTLNDGDSKVFRKTGILPHHNTASHPRRPELES